MNKKRNTQDIEGLHGVLLRTVYDGIVGYRMLSSPTSKELKKCVWISVSNFLGVYFNRFYSLRFLVAIQKRTKKYFYLSIHSLLRKEWYKTDKLTEGRLVKEINYTVQPSKKWKL